jgi:methylthioribose-1-phosphate isomerase
LRALEASPPPDYLYSPESLKAHVEPILAFLFTARPTAVNLGAALRRLAKTLATSIQASKDPQSIAQDLIAEGRKVADEDVGRNKDMSKYGGEWLVERVKNNGGTAEGLNVLTVCNTGSLATSVRLQHMHLCGVGFI